MDLDFWITGLGIGPPVVGAGTQSWEAWTLMVLFCLIGVLGTAMRQGPVGDDEDEDS